MRPVHAVSQVTPERSAGAESGIALRPRMSLYFAATTA